MIKTIIIDDERLARKELKNLLANHNSIEVVAECQNVDDAQEAIENLKPDLIFLDIQMPEKTGFDLLEELDYIPKVVFVTAYDEYAIKAFEVNAFDYILKPVEEKRLNEVLDKVTQTIKREKEEEKSDHKLGENDQIFVKDGEKCWFVMLSNIRLFESEGNYIKVHFENNRPMILKSLNNLEKRLDSKIFFRANRKHIINLRWIEKTENWFNGGLLVELRGGEKIEISRRQAAKLKDIMSL